MTSIVYNQDCLEAMRQMPDNAFDLSVVDPPYGGGGSVNTSQGSEEGLTVIKAVRTGGGWAKRLDQSKNSCVGHCPGGRIFQRAFPCFTQSNNMGRQLF